jgi:hypothetical protein
MCDLDALYHHAKGTPSNGTVLGASIGRQGLEL